MTLTSATPTVSDPRASEQPERRRADRPAGADRAAGQREQRWSQRIVVGSLVVFAVTRAMVLRASDLPAITPDEPGTWAIAKWLSGTAGSIEMLDMPRYPLVSGATLAPLWWLPVDAEVRYRLGLLLGSVIAVLAAIVLRRAVVVLTEDRVLGAVGFATALLAWSTAYTGAFTMAEPTVLLCWSVLMLGAVTLWRAGPLRVVVGTSVAAALAPAVHGRLYAVPLVWCAALAAKAWSERGDRTRRRALVGSAALTLAGAAMAVLAQRAAGAAVWSRAEPALKGSPTGWLTDAEYWVTLAVSAVGQLWYALVATAGLALVGAALLVRMVLRPRAGWERGVGLTLGALLGSNLAISAVVMAGFLHETGYRAEGSLTAPRWDHLVYGRYNDVAIVVLFVLGAVGAARLRHRRLALGLGLASVGLLLAGTAVVQHRLDQVEVLHHFPTPNVAALSMVLPARGTTVLWGFAACAVVLVAAMTLATWLGRSALLLAVGSLLVLSTAAGSHDAATMHSYRLAIDLANQLGEPSADGVVAVAADANEAPFVRKAIYPAQYELVSAGWQTEFRDEASSSLAGVDDAEVLLLVDGVSPGERWQRIDRFDDVVAWRRAG